MFFVFEPELYFSPQIVGVLWIAPKKANHLVIIMCMGISRRHWGRRRPQIPGDVHLKGSFDDLIVQPEYPSCPLRIPRSEFRVVPLGQLRYDIFPVF